MTKLVAFISALAALYFAAHVWHGTAYSYTILWALLVIVMAAAA